MPGSEWLELDGKEVQQVTWPDTESDHGLVLTCTPAQKLTLRAEYMGDRTEVWVSCIRDGREVARHNARMIESIVWADHERLIRPSHTETSLRGPGAA